MIDASKILLENERCTHLTKRLNRLSKWNFFRVLNRVSMGKVFAVNIMVLVLLAPIIYLIFRSMMLVSGVQTTLPYYNSFILGTGIWSTVTDYLAEQTLLVHQETLLWCLLGALPVMFVFSGVFAIFRDAFWVGSINVFKCFGRGVKANIAYAAISTIILEGMIFGLFTFYWWSISVLAQWLAILLTVLLAIVAMLVAIYLLVLCSVTVTYKQSVKQNLADSWRLMWYNTIPNILNFIITCVPIILYVALPSSLSTLILMFILLWGAFWVPFVWQTHMMKTFALFHPVVVNKKGEPKGGNREVSEEAAEQERSEANKAVPAKVRKEAEQKYKQSRNQKIKKAQNDVATEQTAGDGQTFVDEDGHLVRKVVVGEDMVNYEILDAETVEDLDKEKTSAQTDQDNVVTDATEQQDTANK